MKTINRGTLPNDGTGETLYSAFGDINANFQEVTASLAKKIEPAADGSTNLPGALKINGTTVLTGQMPAVANAVTGQEAATINALLSAMRSSGLMAAVAQALQALTLSANSIASGAAAGTVVGTLSGYTPGSTLALTNNANGKFALQGFQLVAGSTPTSFSSSPTETVVVQETLAGATGSPKQSTFTINVANAAPTLVPLTLSNASIQSGAAANTVVGTIKGQTAGSTLSLTNNDGGKFALSGTNLVAGTVPTNAATSTTETVVVTETLAGATGSPKATTLTITVTAAATVPALQVLTLSNNTVRESSSAGTVIGTVQNTTSGSTLSLSDNAGGKVALKNGSLVCGGTAISYSATPTFTCVVTETLAGSPNSPKNTTLTIQVQQAATGNVLYGFPDAASTGVRSGVTLTPVSGTVTITTNGTVYSAKKVTGTIVVNANNVTIQDCEVNAGHADTAVYIPDGYTGCIVEYCDIYDARNGMAGTAEVRFCDIRQVENGLNLYNACLIHDNYVHNMVYNSDSHYDALEIGGGDYTGCRITHNTLINENGQTSAVMLASDFGRTTNVVVDGNYLAGGGYTVYSRDPSNSFTNNYLGQGAYGYYDFLNGDPHLSGNVELGTNWPTPSSASGPGSTGSTGGGTTPTVTLAALTLSNSSVAGGAAAGTTVGAIQGQTNGSALSLSDDGSGHFAISNGNLVTTSTATTGGQTYSVTIVETLSGATNSPKSTTFTISATSTTGQDSMFYPSTTPTGSLQTDASTGLNVGADIHIYTAGQITGVAFYRPSSSANTSVSVGIWRTDDASNSLKASKAATVTGTGWKFIAFDTPVTVAAGQEYRSGVLLNPDGGGHVYYQATSADFASPKTSPLGHFEIIRGLFANGTTLTMPTDSFNDSNYWTDIVHVG